MKILRIEVKDNLMFIEVHNLNKDVDEGRKSVKKLVEKLIKKINTDIIPDVIRVGENIPEFGYIFYTFSKLEFV